MKTIAILGANSQVGSEVALFLAEMPQVRVVGICRSLLASTFVRRCGIECRHGHIDSAGEAVDLVRDCDLVADFAIPRGSPSQIRTAQKKLVEGAMKALKPGAPYVYISSLAALGMPKGPGVPLKHYFLSHTIYGASKRYGERLALDLGKRTARPVFCLRLGQVIGEIQGVSQVYMREARKRAPVVVPSGPSYTVPAFTIAEAISNIAFGLEDPGLYSLISAPPWSYQEVYKYHADWADVAATIKIETPMARSASLAGLGRALRRSVVASAAAFAREHAELIAGNVSIHFPRAEERLFGLYQRQMKTAAAVSSLESGRARPFAGAWIGEVPGPFLRNLSDSRTTMHGPAAAVRARIARATSERPAPVAVSAAAHE
jgi:nucleoside-diphosphate-sugar epimerase